jgi:hypothetical protein
VTITREQVADLRPGDVVELTAGDYVIRGPLHASAGELAVHIWTIRLESGAPYGGAQPDRTLTVISRAPRPLYVNHDRAKPVPGDVVREEDPDGPTTWLMDSFHTWQSADSTRKESDPFEWPLRLLVDGTTGQVVP